MISAKKEAKKRVVAKAAVAVPAVPKVLTAEDVLREAKSLGLFKFNKSLSRYEINVSINDYGKL